MEATGPKIQSPCERDEAQKVYLAILHPDYKTSYHLRIRNKGLTRNGSFQNLDLGLPAPSELE